MARGGSKRTNTPAPQAPPLRVAPHDPRAEESLLGAALLSHDALETLATRTKPEDFHSPNRGHIAAALAAAYEQGWKADPVTIAAHLEKQGLLEQIGGLAHLLDLQVNTPATSSAPRYAEIVHNHATLRRLIGSGDAIAALGYDSPGDVHEAVERAQKLLSDVAANNGARTYSSFDIPDLAALLAGGLVLEQAGLLTRSDGKSLLYPGKMHVLQAEPSSGKSWIVLVAALEVLAIGGAVVYLDYEDNPGGIIGRLVALGAEIEWIVERFKYIRPDGPFGLAEKVELRSILDTLNPDLVVIDGVAEALARDGYDETSNTDVVNWTEKYPRWLARSGATVVMVDHVTKDPDKRNRSARGAGHKKAAVDGASYDVVVTQAFSRHRPGKLQLRIAKDRPGGVGAIGEIAAVVHVEPHADGQVVRITLEPPTVGMSEADPWKPTVLMEKVSRELEGAQSPLTPTAVKAVVPGKSKLVEQAIARLLQEGFIEEVRIGRTVHLTSRHPYRGPADEPPRGTPVPMLTDEQLFDDHPGIPADELAERRRQREQQDKDDE